MSRHKEKLLQSRIMSTVGAIESNLKHASPAKLEGEIVASLIKNIPGSPKVEPIQRASIFAGPLTDDEISGGEQILEETKEVVQFEKIDIPLATEIVFKGVTNELVLIKVRRKINEQWHEHGFPMRSGERIGGEKIIANKKVNFTTNSILQDIIHKAQRPITLMKKEVILDEEGEFVGIRMVPGEKFMKSTSKIVYKDEEGSTKELWLGETGIITEERPKEEAKWYEDPVATVKSKYEDVAETLKSTQTENKTEVKKTKK